MKTLTIGDVTITSVIEHDGPWRRPQDMFRAYDPDIGQRHVAELDRGLAPRVPRLGGGHRHADSADPPRSRRW